MIFTRLGYVAAWLLVMAVGWASPVWVIDKSPACPEGAALDPYVIWEDVKDNNGAAALLRSKISQMGNIDQFTIWLACQGFNVRIYVQPSKRFPDIREPE